MMRDEMPRPSSGGDFEKGARPLSSKPSRTMQSSIATDG